MEAITKTYQPTFSIAELRKSIQVEYAQVACNPAHQIHFTSGIKLAHRLGYSAKTMSYMPSEAIRAFAGVGNPFAIGGLNHGETILDLGSGAGFDCIYASLLSEGLTEIIGLDMTEAMLDKARVNSETANVHNISFMKGYLEEIPLPVQSVDLVISNGVINLCPDKMKVYREIYRVLKPGGRLMIADVLLEKEVPEESKDLMHLWVNCVAGAVSKDRYLEIMREVGFNNPMIGKAYDVFHDARIAKSAAYFGAKGYNIFANK